MVLCFLCKPFLEINFKMMFLHIGIDRSFNVLQSKMLSADIEYDGCLGEGKTIFVWKKSGKIKEFQVSSLMKTLHEELSA